VKSKPAIQSPLLVAEMIGTRILKRVGDGRVMNRPWLPGRHPRLRGWRFIVVFRPFQKHILFCETKGMMISCVGRCAWASHPVATFD
jgi:hypothetical protein